MTKIWGCLTYDITESIIWHVTPSIWSLRQQIIIPYLWTLKAVHNLQYILHNTLCLMLYNTILIYCSVSSIKYVMCYMIALSDECSPGQLIPAVGGPASEAEARLHAQWQKKQHMLLGGQHKKQKKGMHWGRTTSRCRNKAHCMICSWHCSTDSRTAYNTLFKWYLTGKNNTFS